jgi:chromosome segregation ATPase
MAQKRKTGGNMVSNRSLTLPRHTLILDHQQAFNDYKLQAKATSEELSKAKEKITELQERVSRLTLDKGLYKTEIENYKRQLEDLRSTHAEVTAANAKLQEAVETAEAAAKKSQGEASLQNTQKQANLEKRIEELLKNEGVVKKELIQLRAEYGSLQQKFKNQGEEHSKLFAVRCMSVYFSCWLTVIAGNKEYSQAHCRNC